MAPSDLARLASGDPFASEKTEKDAPPDDEPIEITPEMRAAAAAFGRIGGKIGGPRRAAKLTDDRKSEIAKIAAAARWKK